MTAELVLLISICLFALSVVLFMALRKSDRGYFERKRLDKLVSDVDERMGRLENLTPYFEGELKTKQDQAQTLLDTLNVRLEELKGYASDLAALSKSMETYKQAIDALVVLSKESDRKIEHMESLKGTVVAIGKQMKEHESKVKALENESMKKLEDAYASLGKYINKAKAESESNLSAFENRLSGIVAKKEAQLNKDIVAEEPVVEEPVVEELVPEEPKEAEPVKEEPAAEDSGVEDIPDWLK